MLTRDEFLKGFDLISNKFADNISVYYALSCSSTLGISYFDLNKTSNDLGAYFLKIFGENSQYVGVSFSEYFLLPCVILGIWKSGNCFAGIGTQYTKENTLGFLDFIVVEFVITDGNNFEFGSKLISEFCINQEKFFVWSRDIKKERHTSLKEFAYGIMTSGSTGEPKMIQVPWCCILPNVVELSTKFQVTALDCVFQASPYSFDPFFIELLMTFLNGCSLMIVSNIIKLSPSNLLKTSFCSVNSNSLNYLPSHSGYFKGENYFQLPLQQINKRNISILQMTPSILQQWTNTDIRDIVLSSESQLRILILGGEKFPTEIMKLKHPANKTKIYNIYGITEISCWAFLHEVTAPTDSSVAEVPIGKPLSNIVYKISKNGKFEIGSSLRICLVNDETSVQSEHTVFRKTGDIVQICHGEIYYSGRYDQVVKKYGMKINLSKIEDVFLNENELIKECFCLYDKESLKLGLFFVPVQTSDHEMKIRVVTNEEFQERNYKIPVSKLKNIEKPDCLIEISKTPLNSHGKCNKQYLLQYLKSKICTQHLKPDLETKFRMIWCEVLGIKEIHISSTSFTNLGGNSVLGLELISKLENEGFIVPQDIIVDLLNGETYDNLLKCFSLAQKKSGIPRKRFKSDLEGGGVKLSLVWGFDLGKCVDATPTIFSNNGGERLVIGSHSSKLSCINPDSGCEIWTTFLGDRIESGFSPTIDGTRGFVGCYDCFLYCIDTSNGNVLWKFKTGDMIKSTPCLSTDGKTVYVASYDKNLYCLSVLDGELIKTVKLSEGGVFSSGIVSDSFGTFFIGTLDGTCIAIDQETKNIIWKRTLSSPVFSSPCLIPGKPEILFCEVLGNVQCLDVLKGEKMWVFKAGGNIYSSPIIDNGHIIFGCHDSHLYCLQHNTEPKLKWKQQLDSPVFAKAAIVSGFICAATTKGFLYLCDLTTGSPITRFLLNGEVFSSPVHWNNCLFVGCRDNNVYSLQISSTADG